MPLAESGKHAYVIPVSTDLSKNTNESLTPVSLLISQDLQRRGSLQRQGIYKSTVFKISILFSISSLSLNQRSVREIALKLPKEFIRKKKKTENFQRQTHKWGFEVLEE